MSDLGFHCDGGSQSVRSWVSRKIWQFEGLEDRVMIDMVCRRLSDTSLDYAGLESHLKILMKPAMATEFAAELWSFLNDNGDRGTGQRSSCALLEGQEATCGELTGVSPLGTAVVVRDPRDPCPTAPARTMPSAAVASAYESHVTAKQMLDMRSDLMGTWSAAIYKSAMCALSGDGVDQIYLPSPFSDPQERSVLPSLPMRAPATGALAVSSLGKSRHAEFELFSCQVPTVADVRGRCSPFVRLAQ